MPKQPLRIGVLASEKYGYLRDTIRGIRNFVQAHHCILHAVNPGPQALEQLERWGPDGLIVNLFPEDVEAVQAMRLPTVQLFADYRASWVGYVNVDEIVFGKLGASYFLARNFRHFGIAGTYGLDPLTGARLAGFRQAVQAAGFEVSCASLGDGEPSALTAVTEWLKSQRKPLALLATDDVSGRCIAELCLDADLRVPDDVSILGFGNDDLLCEVAQPTLSSIAISWKRAGYCAAELLFQTLTGRPASQRGVFIEPTHVVERESSNAIAVDDPDVQTALRFIRDHVRDPIGVEDVVAKVPLTRRTLERRFSKLLGRSPWDEIRRVKIQKAKELLVTTELPIEGIARACGFEYSNWMALVFGKATGMSPRDYRKANR